MLKLKTQQKHGKVSLSFYPYTYVRTTVMKSFLFRKEDYGKMLKMSFSEIAQFLQKSHYKKEIDSFATKYSGADLLEMALNRNLADSFKKLIRISSPEIALLVKEYAKSRDVEDIKTIIRGKFTNTENSVISRSVTGAGTLSYERIAFLLEKKSIEDVLKHNGIIDFSLLKSSLKDLKEKNTLVGIENALDRFYYAGLIEFSQTLPKEGDLFRNFLVKEVDITNLLTLLRLKKIKMKKKPIMEFITPTKNDVKDSRMAMLAGLEDTEDISKALQKTEYRNAITKGIEEYMKSGSLMMLENELYKYLLKQSTLLMHQHPLSVDTILGYMFAKDLEVRNLKIIVKGKQLGLGESFIESQLVY